MDGFVLNILNFQTKRAKECSPGILSALWCVMIVRKWKDLQKVGYAKDVNERRTCLVFASFSSSGFVAKCQGSSCLKWSRVLHLGYTWQQAWIVESCSSRAQVCKHPGPMFISEGFDRIIYVWNIFGVYRKIVKHFRDVECRKIRSFSRLILKYNIGGIVTHYCLTRVFGLDW